jgi:Ice-binding-like
MWPVAFALAAFVVAGCGGGGSDAPAVADAGAGPVDPVGAVCTAGAECVPLGTAGNYVILAMSGVTTTGTSAITGHVGSASAASSTTGFSETLDASNTFATSAQVTGRLYAFDYAEPTPTELTTATATDATAAFNDVDNNKTVGVGNLDLGTAGNITGLDLAPGVYEWTTGVTVDAASTVTLTGGPTAVWVFKIPGGITMNPGATVTLVGGALPQNVFWRAGGVVALNTTANLKGIVLSSSSVTLADGASVNGRLIATTNVTLIHNTVTRP